LLISIIVVFAKIVSGETILWDERIEDAISLGIVVPESEFTEQSVIHISRRVLKENPFTFVSLAVLTDSRQRFDATFTSHLSAEVWMRNCKREISSHVRTAEMIKVGTNAVLRIRNGSIFRRLVLAGGDPLIHRTSTTVFEIVHISLHRTGVFPFVIYARSEGNLTASGAEEVYKAFQQRLPSSAIYLVARRDAWFYAGGVIATCWWGIKPPISVPAMMAGPQITCAKFRPNEPACSER
jgi:hypothetical protein